MGFHTHSRKEKTLATIYDIAERCGTSAATVSYVINGRAREKRISVATQEKIMRAARELGYKRLKPERTSNPVIAVYWIHKHLELTMPSIVSGINSAVSSEISPVDVIMRPFEQGHIYKQKRLWENGSCDVAIIVGANSEDLSYLEENITKVPTILFNRELKGYSSATVDHEEAGRLTAEHAILKGGSGLALVLNPSALFGLNYRGKAILQTCRKENIDMRGSLFYCENGIDNGYELAWEMIRKNRLKKVIMCIYDVVALGMMCALNEAGIKVGEDVEVIATSSGPSRLFARTIPPLTVVDLKAEEIAARAVKMAIDFSTGRLTAPQKIVVSPEIIYRKSCPMGGSENMM